MFRDTFLELETLPTDESNLDDFTFAVRVDNRACMQSTAMSQVMEFERLAWPRRLVADCFANVSVLPERETWWIVERLSP